jgi:hypothetical protein
MGREHGRLSLKVFEKKDAAARKNQIEIIA